MTSHALLAPPEDYVNYDHQAPLDEVVLPISDLQARYSPYQRRIRFLQALAQGHTVSWAARYCGQSYVQMYDWQKEIPAFREAWKWAKDEAGGDIWEDRLLRISQQDYHWGAANLATIVGLKMRKRFVENAPAGQAPIQVQIINVIRAEGAPDRLVATPTVEVLSPPPPPATPKS